MKSGRLPEGAPGPLIWTLGLGALGLAWSVTTVAAYLPPLLGRFTDSGTLIGFILGAEGIFALFLPLIIGPLSDATRTPLGRRRPYMAFAVVPLAFALALLAFMPSLWATAFIFFSFSLAYYVYEPPYRGLYPDLMPPSAVGRSQGAQHVMRGIALGGALVLGGVLLGVWEPFPFVVAAVITLVSCSAVIWLVREPELPPPPADGKRSQLATPFRIVRTYPKVRWFLIANTAWEATFAGMRTFVVLYITVGLGQPLWLSSVVLATVGGGYLLSAILAGRLGDRFGLGWVIVGASVVYGVGLLGAMAAQSWHSWYFALIFVVSIAGGTVMTLSWGLLFKIMPVGNEGSVSGLAIMTKGLGLLIGPPIVGVTIDVAGTFLESTSGYAAMWVVIGLPVLAAIPYVVKLARAEDTSDAARLSGTPGVS
jgi:Na+/melibiose symporter-like transporter